MIFIQICEGYSMLLWDVASWVDMGGCAIVGQFSVFCNSLHFGIPKRIGDNEW